MRRLHGLDAVRGIAALVVAFHHLSALAIGRGIPVLPFLAVDLFFLISGFVMARTYENRLRNGLSAKAFVLLRYRRLFLPVAIGTTLGLLWIAPAFTIRSVAAYALALAFLPIFWLPRAFIFNTPAWSLFLEIVANALHGAIFARLSVRGLQALLAAVAVVFSVLFASGYARWADGLWPILSCLPRELTFYLAGILVFRTRGDAPFDFARGQKWAIWLGALSFPLYATHVPVMHLAMSWFGSSPPPALAIALAFAGLLTATIERVHIKKLNRRAEDASVVGYAARL